MKSALDIGETLKLGWDTFTNNAVPLIVGYLLVALIGGISLGIAAGPMVVGFNRMCLRAARGESIEIGDVFAGFSQFIPALVLMILAVVIIMLGFLLLIIPGIILAFMFFWATWILAADDAEGAIDALKGSIDVFKRDIGASAVFVLVNVLVSAVGGFVPFGGLVTGPIAAMMAAHAYARMSAEAPSAAAAHAPA